MARHNRSRSSARTRRKIERLDPATGSKESPTAARRRLGRPDYRELARKRARRRRVLLGLAAVTVIGLVLAGVALAFYVGGLNSRLQRDAGGVASVLAKRETPSEPFYMLIMGVDRRPEETVSRADTLMLARIDPADKRVTLLSIPRDTRVEIPGHSTTKINAASVYGGPELAVKTVSGFTGLPISHYMEIDFTGFKEIVDALGGVTLDVPHAIDDPLAANHDSRYRYIAPGKQRLTGGQALTFVRSRDYPEGDLMRIQNQQAFLKALARQTLEFQNALKIKGIVDAVVDNVTTDMSVGRVLALANELRGMDIDALETVTVPGSPKYIGRVSYVVADEEAMREMISRIDQGLPAIPPEGQAAGEQGPDPSSVRVAVRNGAGVGGVAADAAGRLAPEGFRIVETGNANQFVYDETLIVHRDAEDKAEIVRQTLGMGKVIPSRGMYSFDADVLVVVGKDWRPGTASR